MRCLFKLVVAVCLAVAAQLLIQPGGAGDEFAFATRVYMDVTVLGGRIDAPEMLDAAVRLTGRQARMPENLRKLREGAVAREDQAEVVVARPDRDVCAVEPGDPELACAR